MKALVDGIPKAKELLSGKNFIEAAKGIMTTDQYPKYAACTGKLGSAKYTLAVLAKGAGMLRPDMATMLAYVVTDLAFTKKALSEIFRKAVEVTLNRITVDGDTSTNDTVLILANGRAGNKPIVAGSKEAKMIEGQLKALLEDMARKIALDGEGATKCCDVKISGARSVADAKKISYSIGNSPLVKTALFGCDPNWGRIMAAIGYSGADVIPEKISIHIGPYHVVKKGIGVPTTKEALVSNFMKKNKHMDITVNLGLGKGCFHVYMSDLTYDYVHLNAEYHT
ncbi:MAG: bifunctional ornithine acetyltransferase/N-acetylglutamate synthase protein [uncultured bacterium]|nr:MAG: bifunctional ornithine acetyltransferase/N-acetylglutamate synthase protein [uncultured bacterium]